MAQETARTDAARMGEVAGGGDDGFLLEGVWAYRLYTVLKGVAIWNDGGQIEFFREFPLPLGAQAGGDNDKGLPLPLRPHLGDDQAGLDDFAEARLVRQNRALHEGGTERIQRLLRLMRVEGHPRVGKGGR